MPLTANEHGGTGPHEHTCPDCGISWSHTEVVPTFDEGVDCRWFSNLCCGACMLKHQTEDAGRDYARGLAETTGGMLTLEFRQRSTKRVDRGRLPIEESPLWGGAAQGGLF
jgi:hypothetical protein